MSEEIQQAVQIIRVGYDGLEIAMKIGSGTIEQIKNAIDFLIAIMEREKTMGKTDMRRLLMKGGDLQVLQFATEDMKQVEKMAKKYGILYSVLPDINRKDRMSEIIFHTEAVPRVNMMIQKLKSARLATFDDYLKNGDAKELEKDMTTKVLQKKYLGIESDIIKQQRVRNKNNDFSSEISYNKRIEKKEIEEIMDDVRENDQCLYYVAVTIILMADSKEELDSMTETVETIGKRNSVTIEEHYLKQREALNTALPIGVRQVETMRTMLTQSLAVLMPFNVQELNDGSGCYYGINQVSKNINIGNRKKLINGNGFVFGVPGSDKSHFCKMELGQVFLAGEDEIIIIDPMNGATRWQLKRLSTYASRLYKNN